MCRILSADNKRRKTRDYWFDSIVRDLVGDSANSVFVKPWRNIRFISESDVNGRGALVHVFQIYRARNIEDEASAFRLHVPLRVINGVSVRTGHVETVEWSLADARPERGRGGRGVNQLYPGIERIAGVWKTGVGKVAVVQFIESRLD
jgi:hypothetical protein